MLQLLRDFGQSFFTDMHPGGGSLRGEERGLSELVMYCTGKPLDKREQCSEWLRRPLRQNQVNYAGMQQFCALTSQ